MINTIYVPTVIFMASVYLLCADWVSQKIVNLSLKNNTAKNCEFVNSANIANAWIKKEPFKIR